MRALILWSALLIAAPVAAQPTASAPVAERAISDADLRAYGDWVEKALKSQQAIIARYGQITPRLGRAVAQMRDPKALNAAIAELRAIIAEAKPVYLQAKADLEALSPLPDALDAAVPFPTRKLREDFLLTNERTMDTLNAAEALAKAIAQRDSKAAALANAKMGESATLLIDGQLVIVRARRAVLKPDDSTYQALGLMEVVYQSASLLVKSAIRRARPAPESLNRLAANARTLSENGRVLMARERDELAKLKPRSDSDRKQIDMASQMLALESETFQIGDELASTLTKMAAAPPETPLLGQSSALMAFEGRFAAVTEKQAAILAQAR
ncbi:MAG: hypothetical protein ACKVOP_02650 [Sphingomonadaceae bacterium]